MHGYDLDRWERSLYKYHSKASLSEWAPTLRFFRYCRRGHGDESDSLRVALKFESRSDLERLFSHLAIPLVILPPEEPRPVPGQSYGGDEFFNFRPAVRRFPEIMQPAYVTVLGVSIFVWVHDDRMEIDSKGENAWDVDETAIASARRLEPLLEPLAAQVLDPPKDTKYCICPKYYPELWASSSGPPTGTSSA